MQEDPDKIEVKDYYNNTISMIADFVMGFVLNIVVGGMTLGLYSLLSSAFSSMDLYAGHPIITIVSLTLSGLICTGEYLVIQHYTKTRRYLAIGLTATLILPLLITGFCSAAFIRVF